MPHVTETFVPALPPNHPLGGGRAVRTRQPPREIVKTLHAELATVGLPVRGEEAGEQPTFGVEAAENLSRFQERHRLPANGELDPTTGGVLSLAALVTTERDLVRLRERLTDARGAVEGSAKYDEWLGRFAIVAGDYRLASEHAGKLRDLVTGVDLGPIVVSPERPVPQAPEIPFPENFYTFRYQLLSAAAIDELRSARTSSRSGVIRRDQKPEPPSDTDPEIDVHPFPVEDPPPPAGDRKIRLADSADAWLDAMQSWLEGNRELRVGRYASAVAAYDRCRLAALRYFAQCPDRDFKFTGTTIDLRIDELLWQLDHDRARVSDLWGALGWRRQLLSLAELAANDWINPFDPSPLRPSDIAWRLLDANLKGLDGPADFPTLGQHRGSVLDARLVVIATILAPLARGEANRQRRQYAAARIDFERVLRTEIRVPGRTPISIALPCAFIEIPFARLLLVETLIEQGEAQYKARELVSEIDDDFTRGGATSKLHSLRDELNGRGIPGDTRPGAKPFQDLVAAATYGDALGAFGSDDRYVENTKQALYDLHARIGDVLTTGDLRALEATGQALTLPTAVPKLVGSTSDAHPHEPYLALVSGDASALRERNPRVYGLALQALARLVQIWRGDNYLGYRDDYVPPWRFAHLLDRARYLAEHAKNAQRDYLNFLANAESEELKELSAGQAVELEKANVAIETARVDQSAREVTAAHESKKLATLTAENAQDRLDEYKDYRNGSKWIDRLVNVAQIGAGVALVASGGGALAGAGLIASGATSGVRAELGEAFLPDREQSNLERALAEAQQGVSVAQALVDVAKAGLVVAGLQRQAALLRHAHALQTLQFMRNRTLSSEQWYRLAAAIRAVGDTYLRYAIELAFLAQQTYNFEADKRLKVIRFDYDLSDVGAMLAADFLRRDLDTLEQDLIVSQTSRLQHMRYVVSLAREYPEALRELGESGEVTFSVRLEQLERLFRGMLGLRIASVELVPIALMDPTRTSVELTHLGIGSVRLRARPGGSPLDMSDVPATDDWLGDAGASWPIKIVASGGESAVFSGLSRAEAATASAIAAVERGAFEGLPAASSWKLDMSMKENQIVPGSLADVLLTFVVAGTSDSELRDVVIAAQSTATRPRTTTRLISARRSFPDAHRALVEGGRADFGIEARSLSLSGTPGKLRNIGLVLPRVDDGLELGRAYCRYRIAIEVGDATVAAVTALPRVVVEPSGLTLTCQYDDATAPSTKVTWNFGDGTAPATGVDVQHTYQRAGRYEVTARIVTGKRLATYRSAVVVSANHAVLGPFVVIPALTAAPLANGKVPVTIALPSGTSRVALDCAVGNFRERSAGGPITFELPVGSHVLTFGALRDLSARVYSDYRHLPDRKIAVQRGIVATNRAFDADGNEITANRNAFAKHVFGDGELSPVDRWSVELPVAENRWFASASLDDDIAFDASDIADVLLALQFEEDAST
jgi:hypothetical protein